MNTLEDKAKKLSQMINEAKRICVFTGAGISVPSGIPDFRSSNGIYSKKFKATLEPEEIISHSFFENYPDIFYDFYKSKMVYPNAEPNSAHRYFAELENTGKSVSVVTQNIDGLHQAAGSTNVVELHGSIHRNHCTKCGKFYNGIDCIVNSDSIPRCSCRGIIKPDVTLYEESLDESAIEKAIDYISESELMIIIGTSLAVYPAASFVRYFRGENLVIINKSATEYDSNTDLAIHADITEVIELLKK